jgi:C4-dicarboxylate transporter DctM subunit
VVNILFIVMAALFILSVPIAIALGYSSIFALSYQGVPVITVAQSIFESLDSFTLMAVPFFILAGNLMQSSGISRRLINLANSLVGWFRGGLGSVAVLTSMFFATMSGSSSATTAAVGTTLIPAMEKKGYPKNFATAISASSGELGVIIPPSIPLIVYGLVANVSIGSLFIAGILPGIMIGITLMITIGIVARIKGFDVVTPMTGKQWTAGVWKAFKEAFFAILMPVIILGGIYSGQFTPTESSVVAVVYGFIIGAFVYKELKMKDIMKILTNSAITTSIIMLIVGFSSGFAYILTMNQVPHKVAEFIGNVAPGPIVFLLLVNLVLFITGMFIETLPALIILGPILLPAALQFGIDPVHFGIIMVCNLAVGMVTPPLGVNLFIACQIANIRIGQLMRPLLIFLAVLVFDVLLLSYIPEISLLLVN